MLSRNKSHDSDCRLSYTPHGIKLSPAPVDKSSTCARVRYRCIDIVEKFIVIALSTLPLFTSPPATLVEKALIVHERLALYYQAPIPFFSNKDPLSELVDTLLSHRTLNRDSARAYRSLRQRFPTWEEVRDAPMAEVEAAIAAVQWPEQKAPRIQNALRIISQQHGTLTLDFLADLSVVEARQWLEAIPGVGPKTSAATVLFSSLRMSALPVDSHHHRVAQRLGLIAANVGPEAAHRLLEKQLPADWSAQQIYDNHEVLMLHGQRCCFFRNPACNRCPVLDLCPFGKNGVTE